PRFRLAGTTPLRTARPLALVRVARPYRALWTTRGAYLDGWTRPGRPVEIRLFGGDRPGRRDVVLTLSVTDRARAPQRYNLANGDTISRGAVEPGQGGRVRFAARVPSGGLAAA